MSTAMAAGMAGFNYSEGPTWSEPHRTCKPLLVATCILLRLWLCADLYTPLQRREEQKNGCHIFWQRLIKNYCEHKNIPCFVLRWHTGSGKRRKEARASECHGLRSLPLWYTLRWYFVLLSPLLLGPLSQ